MLNKVFKIPPNSKGVKKGAICKKKRGILLSTMFLCKALLKLLLGSRAVVSKFLPSYLWILTSNSSQMSNLSKSSLINGSHDEANTISSHIKDGSTLELIILEVLSWKLQNENHSVHFWWVLFPELDALSRPWRGGESPSLFSFTLPSF